MPDDDEKPERDALDLHPDDRARYEALRAGLTNEDGVLQVPPDCDLPLDKVPGIKEVSFAKFRRRGGVRPGKT